MNDTKLEQFIDKLLLELLQLPELSEVEDFNVLMNLMDQVQKTLKRDEEEFFEIDKLTPREFLIFTFAILSSTTPDRMEIEKTFFYLANRIRERKGLPLEQSTEEIEWQKQYEDIIEEQRREDYHEENDQFREFLNKGYDDNLDPDQQKEGFW